MISNRQIAERRKGDSQIILYGILAAILMLAAVLRSWRIGAISFTYDGATLRNLAASLVDAGHVPLPGMVSSTGTRDPALRVVILSLPALLSRDPRALVGFVVLLNVAGVSAIYWRGRRCWSRRVGLLSTSCFAVSPWGVQRSRGIEGHDFLIPGAVLLFVHCLICVFRARIAT